MLMYCSTRMPYADTVATFTYYITQLCAMKLAYIQLVRYSPWTDVPAAPNPGQSEGVLRGVPHDVVAVYGGLVKPTASALEKHSEAALRGPAMPKPAFDELNPTPTRLFVNAGLTPQEAETYLADGVVDGTVFGMMWITNPDFQSRLEKGQPVNTNPDYVTLQHGVGDDFKIGYREVVRALSASQAKTVRSGRRASILLCLEAYQSQIDYRLGLLDQLFPSFTD